MPVRIVVVILSAIVVIAVGAVLLLPGSNDEPAVAAAPRSPADNVAPAAAAPLDLAAGAPAIAQPPVVAAAPERAADAALAVDLMALAAARTVGAPNESAGATLVEAAAVDNRITFTLRVPIAGGEYELDGERDVILPGLEAFACDDGACFEVTPVAIAAACTDAELGPLLQRGAVVRYRYVDLADEDLGDVTIAAVNCIA